MRSVPITLVLAVSSVVVAACAAGPGDCAGTTTTYSARADRRPPPTRTLHSTGFVDNAGRTSEQTNRTEASGMRATETGSERPTGTAGSGLPLPVEPIAPDAQMGEGAGSLGGGEGKGSGAPGDMLVGRVAQARCDREVACDRVGEGKPFTTTAQCTTTIRNVARADVVAAECTRGFDNAQVGICLTSIRQFKCESILGGIDALDQCQRSALCAP